MRVSIKFGILVGILCGLRELRTLFVPRPTTVIYGRVQPLGSFLIGIDRSLTSST